MKRQEIKDILFDMGASTKLLEMPAVMERLYNYYARYSEEELRKKIDIGPNGDIICKEKYNDKTARSFCIKENGEAVYKNDELSGAESHGEYYIDEFGMDRGFYDGDPLDRTYSLTRTLEGIKIRITNEGIPEVKEYVEEDKGDPILNYHNYTTIQKGFINQMDFEGNKDFLTEHYPITKGWFEIREGIRTEEKEELEEKSKDPEYNEEVENLKNRIKTIEEQHKIELEKLNKEKENLQRMLQTALKVCEDVSRSPFGKLFFGKKLKKLQEAREK